MLRFAAACLILAAGFGAAIAISQASPNDTAATQTFTFTNEGIVTYTIPTVTETVTVTAPPPPAPAPPPPAPPPPTPPPPPPNPCTKELSPGGDLSNFLATLAPGDVGCLHAGDYTDGCTISWTGSSATLQPYGDEHVVVHTSIGLAGNNLTVRRLEVTIPSSCGTSTSGMTVQGSNDTIEFNYIHDVPRHGILTNTSSSNVTIHGNFIAHTGSTCNLDHSIYFQTSGRITRNVLSDPRCGYGIHLYSAPHDVVVAENTAVGSRVRDGIVVNTSGGNIRVVNNIFADNIGTGSNGYGMNLAVCGSGCLFDNNIAWGNRLGDCEGSLCSQATNTRHVDPLFADASFRVAQASPAVDTARTDFAFFPDLDGVQAVVGAGPDLGAYER